MRLVFGVFIALAVWNISEKAYGHPTQVPNLRNALKVVLPQHPNPGVLEIQHPEVFDRVFAISDVHGMFGSLRKLLVARKIIYYTADGQLHWGAQKSLLVVVGDSINKGPDSLDVLNLWRQLALLAPKDGGAVVHLLGNHEANFLADPKNPKLAVFIDELRRKGVTPQEMLDPNNPAFPLARFLRDMPVALRLGHFLFCHSGFYPALPWQVFKTQTSYALTQGTYWASVLSDENSILEAKDWWKDPVKRGQLQGRLFANGFYGVIFGHQASAFGVHDDIVGVDGLRMIKIDTGMQPEKETNVTEDPGHLLLFSNAKDLSAMAPPEAYSLSPFAVRRLPAQ